MLGDKRTLAEEIQDQAPELAISIFDVEGHDELHSILSTLPLFPYMDIKVTPLARHPSAI